MAKHMRPLGVLILLTWLLYFSSQHGRTHEPKNRHGGTRGIAIRRYASDPTTFRKKDNGPPEWGDDEDDAPAPPPYKWTRLLKEKNGVRFPVTTSRPEVQDFVNQGVGQLHVFDKREAERSFLQAARLDPGCAMAYWGLALANRHDEKRARLFVDAARKCFRRTLRENMYLDALDAYLKAGPAKDKERRSAYAQALERIAYSYPEDLEARAFLALQLWDNDRHGVPMSSRLAVDALFQQVLAVNPSHPCHHHRILLWSTEQPELALDSASQCAALLNSSGRPWHMAARVYAPLTRYADAAWYQEACLRAQHAYAQREGLLPDQIPGYSRNQEWLVRTLAKIGRAAEAVERARQMIELPRHPRYNSGTDKGSSYRGRQCLRAVLAEYELWDEMLDLAARTFPEAGEDYLEHVRQRRCLGRAYFHKGINQQDAASLRAGRAELATLEAQAGRKHTPTEEREWQAAVQELKGLNRLADGEAKEGLRLLRRAGDVDPLFLADVLRRAEQPDEAENLLMQQVEERPNEVLPLAHLVDLRWRMGRRLEAEQAFRELRKVAGQADLQAPVLQRVSAIARNLGFAADWRIPSRLSTAERPALPTLGPRRWTPSSAPAWTLQDAHGQQHSLSEFRGKPVLLIFYLGSGCLHCVEQIQACRLKADEFARLGITVLGISTEDGKTLAKALENFGEDKFPFTLLANPDLTVFKAYRLYDDFQGKPLHGTFLIDKDGMIRWQDMGSEPFSNPSFVLSEARRLLQQEDVPSTEKAESKRTAQKQGIVRE